MNVLAYRVDFLIIHAAFALFSRESSLHEYFT